MFSLLTYMCSGQRLQRHRVEEIEAVQRELFALFAFCPALTTKILSSGGGGTRHDQNNVAGYCYVDTLLAHRLPKEEEGGQSLTEVEMVSLCTKFLTASVYTTVTALQWIMANPVIQPEVQTKLLNEIITLGDYLFPPEQEEEDLMKMPYLKAVVLEGLRRQPAHFLLSHVATEDTSLDRHRVPVATPVNFSVADVSLDEEVWDRLEEFRTERFMDGGEGVGVDLTGSREITMMSFGVGRRICPSLGLAVLDLEYFVANLVREFEWRMVTDCDNGNNGVNLAERPEFTVTMDRLLRARVARRWFDRTR
ncbi:hypothetical protein PR202_ga18635 [Eleusine coracana subsp. coracana]|uniref:Uncharacterized protein n=1 Tax=Eleusine coracana subsp. coracana TaxID=191504 RepID=A0AAV5CT72_ELECO|nr:hypothetical protein PR202_ga18635 [Eleusine coracana subsp. coracana]